MLSDLEPAFARVCAVEMRVETRYVQSQKKKSGTRINVVDLSPYPDEFAW